MTFPALEASEVQRRMTLASAGIFLEGASAYYVAAALVASFHGRAFDPQSGRWIEAQELHMAAEQMEGFGASEEGIPD